MGQVSACCTSLPCSSHLCFQTRPLQIPHAQPGSAPLTLELGYGPPTPLHVSFSHTLTHPVHLGVFSPPPRMFSFSSLSLSTEMNQPLVSSKICSSSRNRSDSYTACQNPTRMGPKQEAAAASCNACRNQNLLDCLYQAHAHPATPRTEALPLPCHLALGPMTASKPC